MQRLRILRIVVAVVVVALAGHLIVPRALAQSDAAPTVQISGVVQSFGADTLDIKPTASPAVWVIVPTDLHVDRGALKPGAQVSVDARWNDLCYTAAAITIKK